MKKKTLCKNQNKSLYKNFLKLIFWLKKKLESLSHLREDLLIIKNFSQKTINKYCFYIVFQFNFLCLITYQNFKYLKIKTLIRLYLFDELTFYLKIFSLHEFFLSILYQFNHKTNIDQNFQISKFHFKFYKLLFNKNDF